MFTTNKAEEKIQEMKAPFFREISLKCKPFSHVQNTNCFDANCFDRTDIGCVTRQTGVRVQPQEAFFFLEMLNASQEDAFACLEMPSLMITIVL